MLKVEGLHHRNKFITIICNVYITYKFYVRPRPDLALLLVVAAPLLVPARRLPGRALLLLSDRLALQSSQYHVPDLGGVVRPTQRRWN